MQSRFRARTALLLLAVVPMTLASLMAGCPGLDNLDLSGIISDAINGALNNNANSNGNDNGSSNPDRTAGAVFFVRGRPIDGFVSATLVVTDLEFITADNKTSARLVLASPAVIDLLSPNFSEFLACAEGAPVGTFTRLRLTITNAELLTTAGLRIDASGLNLPASGKLDLNTQSREYNIRANSLNILEFSLTSGDDAWSLGTGANGRVTLRSDAFAQVRTTLGATGRFTGVIAATDGASDLLVDMSNCQLAFRAGTATVIRRSSGGSLEFSDLEPGATLAIEAEFAPDNLLTATKITLIESE